MELLLFPLKVFFWILSFIGSIIMFFWHMLFYCQPQDGYIACRPDDWHVSRLNAGLFLVFTIALIWLWRRKDRRKKK